MALDQERRVGEEIYALFELARESKDYRAEQFMQWFVKEQVEEVALMQDLLSVVERSKDNLLLVEDFVAREALGEEGDDPTAPPGRRRLASDLGRELLEAVARPRRAPCPATIGVQPSGDADRPERLPRPLPEVEVVAVRRRSARRRRSEAWRRCR